MRLKITINTFRMEWIPLSIFGQNVPTIVTWPWSWPMSNQPRMHLELLACFGDRFCTILELYREMPCTKFRSQCCESLVLGIWPNLDMLRGLKILKKYSSEPPRNKLSLTVFLVSLQLLVLQLSTGSVYPPPSKWGWRNCHNFAEMVTSARIHNHGLRVGVGVEGNE